MPKVPVKLIGRAAAGIAGVALPIITAPFPVDNIFQTGPVSKKVAATTTGKVFVIGTQVGGAITIGMLIYDAHGAYRKGWRIVPGGGLKKWPPIFVNINESLNGGDSISLPSQPGVPSKKSKARKTIRGRRPAPWCRRHQRRHWCQYTR